MLIVASSRFTTALDRIARAQREFARLRYPAVSIPERERSFGSRFAACDYRVNTKGAGGILCSRARAIRDGKRPSTIPRTTSAGRISRYAGQHFSRRTRVSRMKVSSGRMVYRIIFRTIFFTWPLDCIKKIAYLLRGSVLAWRLAAQGPWIIIERRGSRGWSRISMWSTQCVRTHGSLSDCV